MHAARSRPATSAGGKALLVRLRAATADSHRRVEGRLFPSAVADRPSYTTMLQVLLALHEPWEARLAAVPGFPALGVDLRSRRKAPRLRADLAALQVELPQSHRSAPEP